MSYEFDFNLVLKKEDLTPEELVKASQQLEMVGKWAEVMESNLGHGIQQCYTHFKTQPNFDMTLWSGGTALALKTLMLRIYQAQYGKCQHADRQALVKVITDSIERVLLPS